jgi:nucleoside-diphosphate-sugar epimerase
VRIVVTGAAGFIGSTLCERLVREGNEVLGLDAFIPYYDPGRKEANLASLRAESSFSFQSLDLRVDDLRPVLDGADVVVHEAAMPGLPKSWTEFELYTTCNLIGTQRLAEACHQVGVRRLVHASTSSVYGAQAVGAEDMPKRPVSPYGVTKLAAESLLQAYVQSFDLPVVVLRYFSIYGPRQRPDMAFHIFIERIRRAEAISVYGDGLQSRSFTFVDDCVAGTVAAIERGRLGETYNIGGGNAGHRAQDRPPAEPGRRPAGDPRRHDEGAAGTGVRAVGVHGRRAGPPSGLASPGNAGLTSADGEDQATDRTGPESPDARSRYRSR